MIDDFDQPQFCEDYGYCICGNDCFNPDAEAELRRFYEESE